MLGAPEMERVAIPCFVGVEADGFDTAARLARNFAVGGHDARVHSRSLRSPNATAVPASVRRVNDLRTRGSDTPVISESSRDVRGQSRNSRSI